MTVDLIDGLAGIYGVHIRVRHELPDASMRLMATLGVVVTIDPDAPECERFDGWNRDQLVHCKRCKRVERERQAA